MATGKLFQVLTAFACGSATLCMGSIFVWPSYTNSLLTAEDTKILTTPMTDTEISLLGSLPSLGAMVGSAAVGPLIEGYGRKLGGTIMTLSYVISWSIICLSKTSIPLLAARFLGGIGGGANLVFAPIFISEVAEDSIRGALASAPILFFNIGALFSFLMGWFLGYSTIVWINLALGVTSCCLLMCVPESPVFLMKRNREENARVSMATYRGVSQSSMVVQKELSRIKQGITPVVELDTMNNEAEKEKLTSSKEVVNVIEPKPPAIKILFKSTASRRAFFIVLTALSLQVVMGIGPVQVYAKNVFERADPIRANLYCVIFQLVVVTGSIVTGVITDKAGRRVLIITSSLLVGVCMATLGFLLQTGIGPGWLTVLMLLLFCFCFMCGAGSVPYVLMAEVFSPEVQACASMLIIEWFWFINFVNLAMFTVLNRLVGVHVSFYVFAVNSVVNAVVSYIFVPETKGLANKEIQELFLRRRRR